MLYYKFLNFPTVWHYKLLTILFDNSLVKHYKNGVNSADFVNVTVLSQNSYVDAVQTQ